MLAAGMGAALVLSACGSSGGSSTVSTGGNNTPGATVTARSTSMGKVLTNSAGKTLYLLTADTASKLACTGSCVQLWIPLMAPSSGAPQAGSGVTGALSTVSRDSGKQVTIAGHPLYTYTADGSPGDVSGQGVTSFGGTWYAVDTSGQAVTTSMGGTSSSPPSGGYQY
jgi:predicted lipoprotein with Yx(FWY)xxD motif